MTFDDPLGNFAEFVRTEVAIKHFAHDVQITAGVVLEGAFHQRLEGVKRARDLVQQVRDER